MIWLACAEPGIGKENIYGAKRLFDLGHHGLNVAFHGHIADHRLRAQLLGERAQRGAIEVTERQLRATRGKFTGERRANAACGTCEDNRFALKIQSGLPSFWHPSLTSRGCGSAL